MTGQALDHFGSPDFLSQRQGDLDQRLTASPQVACQCGSPPERQLRCLEGVWGDRKDVAIESWRDVDHGRVSTVDAGLLPWGKEVHPGVIGV